jgi:hypothetical protein
MATPATGLRPCAITVNIFSGARTSMPPGLEVLLTLRNGAQAETPLPNNGFFKASTINIEALPFFDNFGDNYTVLASASGYSQAGFTPVKVSPLAPAAVDVMLIPKDPSFNFNGARWDSLKQNSIPYTRLLAAGAADDAAAQDRYTQLMENQSEVLACFFNLVTAMSQIHLPVGTPLDYIQQLIWDNSGGQEPKRDRFFAWADAKMVDQVALAASHGEFAPEVGTALLHPGATKSWKQVQFGEANVQLTFHENQNQNVNGIDCVVVEPDIDYYKDLLAHAILEVIPNGVTGTLTDPRVVYVLRWIAGRHAGVADFDPPYILQ